jgi:hypothetical protein
VFFRPRAVTTSGSGEDVRGEIDILTTFHTIIE